MKKTLIGILMCSVIAAISFVGAGISLTAKSVAAQEGGTLYYFVNSGAAVVTEIESGLGLDKATLGHTDKSYADGGYGYTTAGTVIDGDGLNSYRTGAEYKFTLEQGNYCVTVGTVGESAFKVNETDVTPSGSVTATQAQSNGEIIVSSAGNIAFIAITSVGSKIIVNVESPADQMLEYGAVAEGKATAFYSDGTQGEVNIDWQNLNANELNQNFMMTEVTGIVEGTNYYVSSRFFTMPKGLVYFANCGSYENEPPYADGTVRNDVYYGLVNAILTNYEGLINTVADQEYSGSATWGYTPYKAGYPTSSKQLPDKAGDPYPPSFPYNTIRCTDASPYSIEYTFGELSGNYRVYVGTKSHWHGRTVTPYINGDAKENFVVDAISKVNIYDDVASTADGKITIKLQGKSTDEGNIAFIAIAPMSAVSEIPTAPTAPEFEGSLGLGETEFSVDNVAAGDKIQVSLASSPYSVLYEGVATADGMHGISIPAEKLVDVYQLRVAAINAGGVSEYRNIYITDITEFSVSQDINDWTTSDVTFVISAAAASGITKMEVTKNYYTTTVELDGEEVYNGSYTVSENGSYEIKIFSGSNAFMSVIKEVLVIDREDVTVTVNAASSGYIDGKVALELSFESVAEAASYAVYKDGVKLSGGENIDDVLLLSEGRYTLVVTSASGKVGAETVIISAQPKYFSFEKEGDTYTLSGKNGKEIDRVFAYGLSDGNASRLMGTGVTFSEYDGNEVFVKVMYKDGTTEFSKLIEVAPVAKSGCSSVADGSSWIFTAVIAIGFVCIATRRKRA